MEESNSTFAPDKTEYHGNNSSSIDIRGNNLVPAGVANLGIPLLILLFSWAFVGSILIVAVTIWSPRLRGLSFNCIIVSLMVATVNYDLVFCTVALKLYTVREWYVDQSLCVGLNTLHAMLTIIISMHVVAMALYRCLSFGFQRNRVNQMLLSRKFVVCNLIGIYVSAFLMFPVKRIIQSAQDDNENLRSALFDAKFLTCLIKLEMRFNAQMTIMATIISLAIIALSYIRIFLVLRAKRSVIRPDGCQAHHSTRTTPVGPSVCPQQIQGTDLSLLSYKREIRHLRMTCMVSILYVTEFLPQPLILYFEWRLGWFESLAVNLLCPVTCGLQWMVYGLYSKEYRREIRSFIKAMICC